MKEQFLPTICANLRVSTASVQGGRQYMEDEYVIKFEQCEHNNGDMFGYFAVFDGHGGDSAAQFARDHLLNEIKKQKDFWSDDDNIVMQAIKAAFITTHTLMWNDVDSWPRTRSGYKSTAGTTASVVIIKNGRVYIAHCGDSSVALGSQTTDDECIAVAHMTEDHKPQDPHEIARIESFGGKVRMKAGIHRVVWNRSKSTQSTSPHKKSTEREEVPFLAVARSLGDLWSYNSEHDAFVVSPEPDICCRLLDPGMHRCLVIASDGLWNMVQAQSAMEIVQKQEEINKMDAMSYRDHAHTLCDEALKGWERQGVRADNTTVIVIYIDDPDSEDYLLNTTPPSPCSEDNICPMASLDDDSLTCAEPVSKSSSLFKDMLMKLPSSRGKIGLERNMKARKPSPLKRTPRKRKNIIYTGLNAKAPQSAPPKLTTSGLSQRQKFNDNYAINNTSNVDSVTTTDTGKKNQDTSVTKGVLGAHRDNATNHDAGTLDPLSSATMLSRCVASQTSKVPWSARLRSKTNGPSESSHDSDQENATECCATADIRGIITAAEIDNHSARKSLTESPVKLSELSGQLGSVAVGLVSSMWPAEETTKELSLSTTSESPTTCLSVLANKNLKIKRTRVIQNGRIAKSAVGRKLSAGVLSYCRRAKRHVRKGYMTRAQLRLVHSKWKR